MDGSWEFDVPEWKSVADEAKDLAAELGRSLEECDALRKQLHNLEVAAPVVQVVHRPACVCVARRHTPAAAFFFTSNLTGKRPAFNKETKRDERKYRMNAHRTRQAVLHVTFARTSAPR